MVSKKDFVKVVVGSGYYNGYEFTAVSNSESSYSEATIPKLKINRVFPCGMSQDQLCEEACKLIDSSC